MNSFAELAAFQGELLLIEAFEMSPARLHHYGWASGDYNPIHHDAARASAMALPGVIAHGMLSMALMSRGLEELSEKIRKASGERLKTSFLDTRFSSMTLRGERVEVRGRVRSVKERVLTLDLSAWRHPLAGGPPVCSCSGRGRLELL